MDQPRRPDLNRIEIFTQVVQAGSFTKAAVLLKQPKSRVSRNISLLEKEVGVQLIYRTTRQFQLTEAGRDFYQKCRQHIEGLNQALGELGARAEEIAGPIRITAPEDVGVQLLGGLCDRFLEKHPRITFDVLLSNQVLDLVKDSVDVALRIGHLKDSSLRRRRIGNLRLFVYASPRLLERMGRPATIETLGEFPALIFSPATRKPVWNLVQDGEKRSLKMNAVVTSTNPFFLKDLCRRGHGVALLPEFIVRDAVEAGDLTPVLRNWSEVGTPLQIVLPRQREVLPRVRIFVDFLVQELSALLG